MSERITNVGQLRRAIEGLSDGYPVEAWLNAVQTYITIDNAGGETGAQLNITVEPNYTCRLAQPDPLLSSWLLWPCRNDR